MSDLSANLPPSLSQEAITELLRSLLQKKGNWIDWGKACQNLQKAGYSPQKIFEETGFQGSQQNLIIVAAQVYESLVQANAEANVLAFFQGPKSDVLYELRILNQHQRLEAAQLAYEKNLDVDGAKELAKAIKEFSQFSQLPEGFTAHPGDAVAYQCWRQARQKKDLQERSRLIAKGLKFAHSGTARSAIEKLLSDFTIVPDRSAPLLPIYRLEAEEEIARIVPFAGALPLSLETFTSLPSVEILEPFRMATLTTPITIVPLPGWQAVLKAQDPVIIICQGHQLPQFPHSPQEDVLVLVDRAVTTWDANCYYLMAQDGQLSIQWSENEPSEVMVAQVLVVVRQKRIFDENNLLEPWQMDD